MNTINTNSGGAATGVASPPPPLLLLLLLVLLMLLLCCCLVSRASPEESNSVNATYVCDPFSTALPMWGQNTCDLTINYLLMGFYELKKLGHARSSQLFNPRHCFFRATKPHDSRTESTP